MRWIGHIVRMYVQYGQSKGVSSRYTVARTYKQMKSREFGSRKFMSSKQPENAESGRLNSATPIERLPTRHSSRYSAMARALASDIELGKYAVGAHLPTENELQQRFDVSRHTVRQALRELKEQGLIIAHPGIGTIVRGKPVPARLAQGITSLSDLLQFVEATRMQVVASNDVVADPVLAELLKCNLGQQWIEVVVSRTLPNEPSPLSQVMIYLRPEHFEVVARIDSSTQPVFSMIESQFGIRIAEVVQEITAVALSPRSARLLKVEPGSPGMQIVRRYQDAQARTVMISVGYYPHDRFSHTTRFRIHRKLDT